MPTEPLRPEDVDALLAPNVRTTVADLLSARDSLLRARVAFERLQGRGEPPRELGLQRRVAGIREARSSLDNALQQRVERQLGTERDTCIDEDTESVELLLW